MAFFKTKYLLKLIAVFIVFFSIGCDKEDAKVREECVDEDFFNEFTSRSFCLSPTFRSVFEQMKFVPTF